MDVRHKLGNFDDSVDEVRQKLRKSEKTGSRVHLASAHGDFVKECVCQGRVVVWWASTKENDADIFTKPISWFDFRKFRAVLMNLD